MADNNTFEPRKKPRQARAQASYDAILEAAAQLFGQRGFTDTNTNLVAERAGVSIGTLYQYFPNKEALVVALNRRYTDDVINMLTARLKDAAHLPVARAVEAMIRAMLEVRADVSAELYEMFGVQVRRLQGYAPLKDTYSRAAELVATWLQQHADIVRPTNYPLAALVVVAAVDKCTETVVLHDAASDELDGAVAEITDLVLRYLFVDQP